MTTSQVFDEQGTNHPFHRFLAGGDDIRGVPSPKFQTVFTIIVLVSMFAVLIRDKVGADSVMLTALTAFYMANIITIKQALAGFSSQGLLTILVLFVVAEGVNKTGALNWYVAKLLGRPQTISGAQLRVMVPIAMLSGFINDTPLVTLAMPLVHQWSRKIGISPRFLMMPLSFAALLGGVCTLIGTSTNLVVAGLLQDQMETYGNIEISLLGIGQYGVPVSMVGIAYVVLVTPLLLARRRNKNGATFEFVDGGGDDFILGDLLLGARVTQWSPAAGRTIRRSGLRDTGGIYLTRYVRFIRVGPSMSSFRFGINMTSFLFVRVHRAATGNTHHAVGPDFVLSAGDTLYFTGVAETFGAFCALHGLEVVSNESQPAAFMSTDSSVEVGGELELPLKGLPTIPEDGNTVGYTLSSLLETSARDRMRIVYRMEDAIRGECDSPVISDMNRVVVTREHKLVVVAVDTLDRSGLLLDISKCLGELELELHHTEAAVRNNRALSIWRCENRSKEFNEKEVWSVLQALLARDEGLRAVKLRGLRVVRARVLSGSRLVGTKASSNFRETYKAAIIAIQKGGKSVTESLSNVKLSVGDILVLQAEGDSPLLESPPSDFYEKLGNRQSERSSGVFSIFRSQSSGPLDQLRSSVDVLETGQNEEAKEAVWKDLQVLLCNNSVDLSASREFLTAMKVEDSSALRGKTVVQGGIDKLPDLFLVSIERPVSVPQSGTDLSSFSTIALDSALQAGDVLWFAGTAAAIGDLRKIPGLVSYQSAEVDKMNTKAYERRLVQAVVSFKGPLVGKTVKEVRFRTQFGAAVIAVQREGVRIHEHAGNIVLRAGDVLLLEAGPSFSTSSMHDSSFIMVSDVKDSAPPRLRMLIPALVLTIGAYVCYMAKVASLWGCGMVAAILMVALGVMSESEARNAIKWEIFTTIGSAFGIGTALVNSGVAGALAEYLVKIGNAIGMGDAGLLGAVYLSTVLISQVVANNAAAALIFPIAMDAAKSSGTDAKLMAYAIMLAASAAFMTPFGYQTNLMVMGPGGYTTADFLLFGTPMQIVLLVATTAFLVSPFWISWLLSFLVLGNVSACRIMYDLKKKKIKMA